MRAFDRDSSRARQRENHRLLLGAFIALVAAAAIQLAFVQRSEAAVAQPCKGVAQITDATGDGHHNNTDVTSAWFSEESGSLQAVIKTAFGDWQPAHEDSEGAGWAFLFKAGSTTSYVRLQAPFPWEGSSVFDYGTWTSAGGFASLGLTTGSTVDGPGGSVTIDIPEVLGTPTGAVLTQNFVLTYDGFEGSTPHWVDRAPGGTGTTGTIYGADFVVGACGAKPGDPGDPDEPVFTTSVTIDAPKKLTGAAKAVITGTVSPAREGIGVDLTTAASKGSATSTRRLQTLEDGSYSATVPIRETSLIRAVAIDNGLGSQTVTVTVRSKVRIKVKRLRRKAVRITGVADPALPGRVLLIGVNDVRPIARKVSGNGRFHFRFKRIKRGRYQAIFIPSQGRAERSTSNTGVIKK